MSNSTRIIALELALDKCDITCHNMTMDGRIKLTEAAKLLDISFRQAQRHAYSGKIPTICSRESSDKNNTAFASQTEILRQYAVANGWFIVRVVKKHGSGVNDQLKKLYALLSKRDYDILLVEYKNPLWLFLVRGHLSI